MELLKQPGGHVWVADAPDWQGNSTKDCVKIGISPQAIQSRADRGLRWQLGQMYGVVATGLIMTQHVFQGLKRDMYVRDDKDAASKKFAATWNAPRDAQLVGDRNDTHLEFVDVLPNRVFAVYISPNGMLTEFPEIFGWADHWTWLGADSSLSGAPVDWETRYDSKVWSRGT